MAALTDLDSDVLLAELEGGCGCFLVAAGVCGIVRGVVVHLVRLLSWERSRLH